MSALISIDSIVNDFFNTATEAILLERKANLQQITSSPHRYSDANDYIKQSLHSFRRDLSKPLIIDLYLFHPGRNTHLLVERWSLSYSLNHDSKESRPLQMITRRVHTLLRSLYCFVRLLPAFNMLHLSSKRPLLNFQMHTQKDAAMSFSAEPSRYAFTPISTSKGVLKASVVFLGSLAVEEVMRAVSGTASSASIPIPSSQQRRPSGTHYDKSRSVDAYTSSGVRRPSSERITSEGVLHPGQSYPPLPPLPEHGYARSLPAEPFSTPPPHTSSPSSALHGLLSNTHAHSASASASQAFSWSSTPPFLNMMSQTTGESSGSSPAENPNPTPLVLGSLTLTSNSPAVSSLPAYLAAQPSMTLMDRKLAYRSRIRASTTQTGTGTGSSSGASPSFLTSYAAYLTNTSSSSMVRLGAGIAEGEQSQQSFVIVLQELEELKMRLAFANASFVPINLLAAHFTTVDASAFICATPSALMELTARLVEGEAVANDLQDSSNGGAGGERSTSEERWSDDCGAAGMMDEDMVDLPFAQQPQQEVLPVSPATHRHNSLTAALDGALLTTSLPTLSSEIGSRLGDFKRFGAAFS